MTVRGFLAVALVALSVTAASAQGLTTKQFADGSGSVGVAPGWSVKDSGNGGAALSGPGGAEMILGLNIPVVSTDVGRIYGGSGIPDGALFPGSFRVSFSSPVLALLDLAAQQARKSGNSSRITQIRRVEPISWPNGQAALIQFSGTANGKPVESYGLFAIQPIDNVQGLFYFSSVAAPAGSYAKLLPTMLAMWKSWTLSKGIQQQRLDAASKSLAEVDWKGTIDSVTEHRRQVALTAARAFQRYIRQ